MATSRKPFSSSWTVACDHGNRRKVKTAIVTFGQGNHELEVEPFIRFKPCGCLWDFRDFPKISEKRGTGPVTKEQKIRK